MRRKRNKPPGTLNFDVIFQGDPRSEIMAYLSARPEAADTVDGIVDWWIPMQRYINAKNKIQQALRVLVQQGQVEEIVLGNGNRLYRLPSNKAQTAMTNCAVKHHQAE